jgi:predicted small lipoprotein YifL
MRQLVSILAILMLLSSCGIKRPLELPGKEKHHKPDQTTEQTDAVRPPDAPRPAMPAPVSQPSVPSVETNPSVLPSSSDANKVQPGQEPVQLHPPAE